MSKELRLALKQFCKDMFARGEVFGSDRVRCYLEMFVEDWNIEHIT